jgi:hypothetical protein
VQYCATFTSDGVVKDVAGKRRDAAAGGVRGFATHFLTRPHRRGGQHHVQHLLVEPAAGGGCRVTCVRVGGQWLIKEKIIDPWNSATAPMVGHLP